MIGAVDGETWVAGATAFSLRLTVPGGVVRAAGLSDVGVAPTHRRRGVLRQDDALAPRSGSRPRRAAVDPPRVRGRHLPALRIRAGDAAGEFRGGAERRSASRGRPSRSDASGWSRATRRCGSSRPSSRRSPRTGSARSTGLPRSGASRSWPMTRGGGASGSRTTRCSRSAASRAATRSIGTRATGTSAGRRASLTIVEVTGLDAAAERALWEWLIGIDLVRKIVAWRTPVPHPLYLQIEDPRRLGLTIGDGLWVRLVDLPAALEARSYVGPGRVTFEVTDAFMPANAGRWTLTVPGDRGAAVGRTGRRRRRARPRPRHRRPRHRLPGRLHLRRPRPRRPGGGVPGRGALRTRIGCS